MRDGCGHERRHGRRDVAEIKRIELMVMLFLGQVQQMLVEKYYVSLSDDSLL